MSTIETSLAPETAARELISQLQAMRQSIPGLVFLSPASVRRMIPVANVPEAFILTVGDAVGRSDLLGRASLLPPSAYADAISLSILYEHVESEGQQFLRGIHDTRLAARYGVAQEALRMYGVAQRFNRPGDREQLVPYINAMRDALGRSRSRIEEPDDDAPPSTTPPAGNGNGGHE
jgi:hypothetical protein